MRKRRIFLHALDMESNDMTSTSTLPKHSSYQPSERARRAFYINLWLWVAFLFTIMPLQFAGVADSILQFVTFGWMLALLVHFFFGIGVPHYGRLKIKWEKDLDTEETLHDTLELKAPHHLYRESDFV